MAFEGGVPHQKSLGINGGPKGNQIAKSDWRKIAVGRENGKFGSRIWRLFYFYPAVEGEERMARKEDIIPTTE